MEQCGQNGAFLWMGTAILPQSCRCERTSKQNDHNRVRNPAPSEDHISESLRAAKCTGTLPYLMWNSRTDSIEAPCETAPPDFLTMLDMKAVMSVNEVLMPSTICSWQFLSSVKHEELTALAAKEVVCQACQSYTSLDKSPTYSSEPLSNGGTLE